MGAFRFSIDPGLVRWLASELPLDVFVETGTFEGASVRAVRPFFSEIHTIELSDQLYEGARRALGDQRGVHLHHGSSPEVLRDLAPRLKERRRLFWLDAHWSDEPGSAGESEGTPLLEELEAIGSLGPDDVVMIDDARLFLAPPPEPMNADRWPGIEQVLAALSSLSEEHAAMVIDDVILFAPVKARAAIEQYAREGAIDWLAEIGRARATNLRLDLVEAELQATRQELQGLQQAVADLDPLVSAAVDEGARALEKQLQSLQGGMAELASGSEAAQKGVADLHTSLASLRTDVEAVHGQLQRQDAELALLQRRVGILSAPLRALAAPFAALGRLLSGPFARARSHWRVWRTRMRPEPKLGRFRHHPPMALQVPDRYLNSGAPKDPPTISIVTPSYNQATFLGRTIRSVLDQDYPRLEYIVQDGGSTDGTRELIESAAPRLKHWEMRADGGQAEAINLGFTHAGGEVMAYLNSDDLLLPGALRYVGRYFEAHPEVDVIYGHRVLVDEEDREIGRWVLPRHRDEILSWADYVPQETLFWRRRAWEAAGGRVDEGFRFAMDWDLLVRLRDSGARIVRVPRFLGAFRVHSAQKSSAELTAAGAEEMAKIRTATHSREVSDEEVARALRPYLRRHVLLHKLYRAGLLRY